MVKSIEMNITLPVYILIDTSNSMFGEGVASLQVSLENITSAIRSDPQLHSAVKISVLTFDNEVVEYQPLSSIDDTNFASIHLQELGGESNLGKALNHLLNQIDSNLADFESHMHPMLIVMTDGHPSDLTLYEEMTQEIKHYRFSSVVACLSGHQSDDSFLKLLTDNIYKLDEVDLTTFGNLFYGIYYGQQRAKGERLSDNLPDEVSIES